MTAREEVLVVPTAVFRKLGYFNGFNPRVEPYLFTIYNQQDTHFMERRLAEANPDYKQIIPYALFERIDQASDQLELFRYRRGPGSGESRLHALTSLGVGGHINHRDILDNPRSNSVFEVGARREVLEEVRFDNPGQVMDFQVAGLINNDDDAVGQVHLGVVILYRLGNGRVYPNEAQMLEAGFVPIPQLYRELDELEPWSQLCLKTLYPVADYFTAEALLGMPGAKATSLAASVGLNVRVVKEDGNPLPVTMEFVPDRINLELSNGKVAVVTKG